MKLAILLAFAAFAFLAQAEAKTVIFGLSDIQDRGAIADYLKAKLAAAKEKLEEMLTKAQDALKEKIDQAKKKAERLIELLKQKADKISDKVFEAANKILDKVDASVAESIPKSHNIEGISECLAMKDTIRVAALAIIANTSSCINDKIEEGESYVLDIYTLTTEAVNSIVEIKEQGIECISDVSGIKEIITATACITKASAKGTVVIGKTVPAVLLTVAKLIKEIATLQASLTYCMPLNALITLTQQAEPVVVSVKDCIKEKIEESTAPKESSEEKPWEEQIIEEEFHNEVLEEKHSKVQPNFGYEAPAQSGPIEVQE